MAATPAPLLWDFYRSVGSDSDVKTGGIVHYYDENAQTIFLNNGIKTRTQHPEGGSWKTSVLSEPSVFINHEELTVLSLDHPSNGILYGAATDGTNLIFYRYIYAMEISNIIDSWSWGTQNDNTIAQFSASLQNVGTDIFTDEVTLFQPGSRVKIGVRFGDSEPYPIGVAWLDECRYDVSGTNVEITGRNSSGYLLKDQTFDDLIEFSGGSTVMISAILDYAGITDYAVQPFEVNDGTYSFKPNQTILAGLEEMASYYTNGDLVYKMLERPDGKIIFGYEAFIDDYQTNSYYSFNEGKDVFKRKTSKMVDGSFTALRATGKDANDADLTPVTVAITNFPYWKLGAHKTIHVEAPKGYTQAKLQSWAEAQAASYQYVGIGEDFTGPFRPQLLVGDIAEVVEDNTGTSLGVITEVKQTFSRKDGFRTEFAVDSGGVSTDGANYIIYSRTANVNGFNRRQRVMDLVRLVAGK